jgi:uncharacterized protein YfeS
VKTDKQQLTAILMVETSYNEFEDDFEDNFDIDDENEELEFGTS